MPEWWNETSFVLGMLTGAPIALVGYWLGGLLCKAIVWAVRSFVKG